MSQFSPLFTPVPQPVPHSVSRGEVVPPIAAKSAVDRLAELFTAEQLDAAIDRAARGSSSAVAVFAAAPVDCWGDGIGTEGVAAIEFVVEFFVPPASLDLFHRELEAQLLILSPRYVTGRYRGEFGPCALHSISAGIFHQYRVTCRASSDDQRDSRWSRDRLLLDGVLHQSRTGWRELGD